MSPARNGKNGHAPTAEQPLPQNLDAERSILGAVLLDNTALPAILKELPPEFTWFALEPHRKIYHAMLAMRDAGSPIDLVSLANELHKRGELESAGGGAYIAQLVDGLPHVAHLAHYCQIVREKAQLRRALYFSHQIAERIATGQTEAAEIFADLRTFSTTETRFAGGVPNGMPHAMDLRDFMALDLPKREHLVEYLVPAGSAVMFFGKAKHLKSWLTMALALQATRPGKILGRKIEVKKAVRTILVSIEDPDEYVQERMGLLLTSPAYRDIEPANLRLITRRMVNGIFLPDPRWHEYLVREISEFKADFVILDVLRNFVKPGLDINKPNDSAELVRAFESIYNETGATIAINHHPKKGDADIFDAAAGSFNITGWAKVLTQFTQRREEKKPRHTVSVNMTSRNSWGLSLDEVRVVLDLQATDPVRIEDEDESTTVQSIEWKLGKEWSARDLMEVAGIERSAAYNRIRKWMDAGIAERVGGSRPTRGGQGHYCFIKSPEEVAE